MNTAWRCTCLISGTYSLIGKFALSSVQTPLYFPSTSTRICMSTDELTIQSPLSLTYGVQSR